ncbi:hypothetical protein PA598K_01260 [Paenibacillus sp. 598K]|nr:hypothetical protein PA598K_01260 [Paenibacillus sp. 598K]
MADKAKARQISESATFGFERGAFLTAGTATVTLEMRLEPFGDHQDKDGDGDKGGDDAEIVPSARG